MAVRLTNVAVVGHSFVRNFQSFVEEEYADSQQHEPVVLENLGLAGCKFHYFTAAAVVFRTKVFARRLGSRRFDVVIILMGDKV